MAVCSRSGCSDNSFLSFLRWKARVSTTDRKKVDYYEDVTSASIDFYCQATCQQQSERKVLNILMLSVKQRCLLGPSARKVDRQLSSASVSRPRMISQGREQHRSCCRLSSFYLIISRASGRLMEWWSHPAESIRHSRYQGVHSNIHPGLSTAGVG